MHIPAVVSTTIHTYYTCSSLCMVFQCGTYIHIPSCGIKVVMSSPPRDVVEFVELGVVPVAIIIIVDSNRIVFHTSRLICL